LSELKQLLVVVDHAVIGKSGGRKMIIDGKEHSISQVAKKFFTLCKKSDYTEKECKLAAEISEKIASVNSNNTYKKGLSKSQKANLMARRTLGNLPGIGLSSSKRSQGQLKAIGFSMMYLHYAKDSTKLRYTLLQQVLRKTGSPRENAKISQSIAEKAENITKASTLLNAKLTKKIQKDNDKWKKIELRLMLRTGF